MFTRSFMFARQEWLIESKCLQARSGDRGKGGMKGFFFSWLTFPGSSHSRHSYPMLKEWGVWLHLCSSNKHFFLDSSLIRFSYFPAFHLVLFKNSFPFKFYNTNNTNKLIAFMLFPISTTHNLGIVSMEKAKQNHIQLKYKLCSTNISHMF